VAPVTSQHSEPGIPRTDVDQIERFSGSDLHDLCDAAEAAIRAGGGFGWIDPPERHVMETYWKGVLLVPERDLFVARLDGVIGGSAQLHRSPRNNEAQAIIGQLSTFFMAPWARGYGLARMLTETVERAALRRGLKVLNLDLRETQIAAIQLYERLGYRRWGTHPHYALIDGRWVQGYFYTKDLDPADLESPAERRPKDSGR
jgi:RimJ/RimL family protein N-acetyltransferase